MRALIISSLIIGLAAPMLAYAAPLDYNTALQLAEQYSPLLAADRAQLHAARSASTAAGELPDPKMLVGVDNLPISGEDAGQLQNDNMTMQKIGIMQTFPNADKRHAQRAIAHANIGVVGAQLEVARAALRRDAALAWLDLYYLQRKQSLLDELVKENRILSEAIRAQIASGRAAAADAVVPEQEAAQLADQHDELNRDILQARARLEQQVGIAINGPLHGDPPHLPIDPANLRKRLHEHPELRAFAATNRRARAEVAEARSMKKSDWDLELAYQRRGPKFGDMISLQLTVDLPLFATSRQDPLIAAKQQEIVSLEAEREGMLREHAAELESTLATHETLTRQLARAQTRVLPLIEQKISLQTASYQAGKGELNHVLDARREHIEQRMRIIELTAQQKEAAARLHFAYGEQTP
jgi:outer membrane protein, heavy metal efflux system